MKVKGAPGEDKVVCNCNAIECNDIEIVIKMGNVMVADKKL